ncbi:MAG TPA: aminotransferase class I/II-fold pyridoxal phosphate-dependent enzyme, partial [Bacteroidetes bacterium]|nr:aminotransferase class I/II-fold pyridoxal phosphate-dependent enzyme [Bacteroidota bacterium]
MDKNLLSYRVKNMPESATLKMAQMARDLKSQGVDIVDMSLGEPDFDTPDDIKEAAKKALDDGYTKYTPVPGLPLLRKAIVNKLKRDNNLDYNIDQIVVTNGAKQAIANICLALLNPGDEVVLFTPYWVSYDSIIKIAEGVPVIVSAGIDQDFKIKPEQLEAAITDKTKLVLFSSPSNPTGSVYTHEELGKLAEVLKKYPNVHIISDEIYEYINFGSGHASIASFDYLKDRVIIVNGMSKGFAMTG